MQIQTCPTCGRDQFNEDPRGKVTYYSTQLCENCGEVEVCGGCAGEIACEDCQRELCPRCSVLMADGCRYCEGCAMRVIEVELDEWRTVRRFAESDQEIEELAMLLRHGREYEIEDTRAARRRRVQLDSAITSYCQALEANNPVAAALAGVELGAILADPLWRASCSTDSGVLMEVERD